MMLSPTPHRYLSGVTLLEILITMSILAIMMTVAIPNLSTFGDNQKLVGLAEQVFGHLQQARSEAVTRSETVFANFAVDGTSSWEYGISLNSECVVTETDPTETDACVIIVDDGDGTFNDADLVLMRFSSTDHDDISMDIANFSSETTEFIFDSVRGTASSGQIELQNSSGKQLRINVSRLGRVSICSPDDSIQNYGAC